jgi:gliding motility-associated-like protein
VLANDFDPDGNSLTVSIILNPRNGTATLFGNNVQYAPAPGFLGSDSVLYRICDNGTPSLCDSAWVHISIIPLVGNRPPVAINDRLVMCSGEGTVVTGVQLNDSDPDLDQLTTGIQSGPFHGTAVVVNNEIEYTPSAGFQGRDSVLYYVCDNGTPSLCSQAYLLVTVNPTPAPLAQTSYKICEGQSVQIGTIAVAGNTYFWTPSTGLSSATTADPVASPLTTTVYTLAEAVTATGCRTVNTVTVTVNPVPAANTGGTSKIVYRGTSQIIGVAPVAGNTYLWTPDYNLVAADASSTRAYPEQTTTYTLTETDPATGCSGTNTITLNVLPLEFYNAISPNGDGINDYWKIPMLDLYTDNEVIITNRFGQDVWRTRNYENYNGNYFRGKNENGVDLPDGVYNYLILYNGTDKMGTLTIKR